LFSAIDSPISLAFLARYPSPEDARGLGEKRLAAFLKAQHYANRKTAAQLLERLRSAAAGRAGEIETRRRRSIVLRLTRTLEMMVKQIGELESEIADALDAHPDGEIFRSFFRSRGSVICAATLLGEIGDCRARYPHRDAIAADAGQAPVAVESGKRKNAKFRWACNKRLRSAPGTLALVTRQSFVANSIVSSATLSRAKRLSSEAPTGGCSWTNPMVRRRGPFRSPSCQRDGLLTKRRPEQRNAPAPAALRSSTSLIAPSWNDRAAAPPVRVRRRTLIIACGDRATRLARPPGRGRGGSVQSRPCSWSPRSRRSAAGGQACRSVDLLDGFPIGSPASAATER
jgi:hypothetical protein